MTVMQGSLSEEEGVGLVHLCATFSANPFIMAFAQVTLVLQWCVQYASMLCTLYRHSLETLSIQNRGFAYGMRHAADQSSSGHHSIHVRKALHAANTLIM